MSTIHIDTTERSGQRPASSYKQSNIVAVFRAPAETPPVTGYFTTRRLSAAAQPAASGSSTPAQRVHTETAPTPRTITKKAARKNALGALEFNPMMPPIGPARFIHPPLTAIGIPSPTPTTGISNPSPSPSVPITRQDPIFVYQPPPVSLQTTPTPVTQPTSPYPVSAVITSGGPGAQTAQGGTPVPVGWPTNQSYVDSSGNVWTYTATGGWQITATTTAAQPITGGTPTGVATPTSTTSTASPGTTIQVAADTTVKDLTSWLQEESVFPGIQNFWVVAGVAGVGMLLWGAVGGKRR